MHMEKTLLRMVEFLWYLLGLKNTLEMEFGCFSKILCLLVHQIQDWCRTKFVNFLSAQECLHTRVTSTPWITVCGQFFEANVLYKASYKFGSSEVSIDSGREANNSGRAEANC